MVNKLKVRPPEACCLVDRKPWFSMSLPPNVVFVGMEKEPNGKLRYGQLYHPWFSKPCYESKPRLTLVPKLRPEGK